ncbi:unnamed protein product, partial [marine sediment metagenome]
DLDDFRSHDYYDEVIEEVCEKLADCEHAIPLWVCVLTELCPEYTPTPEYTPNPGNTPTPEYTPTPDYTSNPGPVTYTLTMAADPVGGGTTSPAVETHTYSSGTVVDITATPASGYQFVDWTGDVADPNSASTTVTMNADKTVTANFELIPAVTYDLTMQVSPIGSGTTIPTVGGSPHNYTEGTVVNITATPASGYQFVDWTGDVADPNSASTTVTMNADKTVTANFELIPAVTYDLTMQVSPIGSGTTIPTVGGSPHNYTEGTVVDITATPASGYQFVDWTGDVADPNSASTTVTMNGDKTVTANFEPTPS